MDIPRWDPEKFMKDTFVVFWIDPWPVIADFNTDIMLGFECFHADHRLFGTVFDSIIKEIMKDICEMDDVGRNVPYIWIQADFNITFWMKVCPEIFCNSPYQLIQGNGFHL